MSSFEMELRSLATDIAAARSRLSAARLSKNMALVQSLEEEIAATEAKRSQLQANIAPDVVGACEPASRVGATGTSNAAPYTTPSADQESALSTVREAEPSIRIEGVTAMSDQLIAIDAIERANRQLATRRAEMMARHAEEIRALDADQGEIETMARAMSAFVRKFGLDSAENSVVRFEDERDLRLQIHG